VASTVYIASVYAKAGEIQRVRLSIATNTEGVYSGGSSDFDLINGSVLTGANGSIIAVGNGWYRCSVFATATQIDSAVYIYPLDSGPSFTGNGFSGIYVWGAQVEAGSFTTSYIKTEASQVTRSADAATMTGTNFSSWYRADEGTLYAEALTTAPGVGGGNRIIVMADNGTTQNIIALLTGSISTGTSGLYVNANNVEQAYIIAGTRLISTGQKLSGAYQVNNFQAANSGTLGAQDTFGILPIVDRLRIGSYPTGAGANILNGTIKKIAYYPARLPNATLQAITAI
jgi:hypothetical protein